MRHRRAAHRDDPSQRPFSTKDRESSDPASSETDVGRDYRSHTCCPGSISGAQVKIGSRHRKVVGGAGAGAKGERDGRLLSTGLYKGGISDSGKSIMGSHDLHRCSSSRCWVTWHYLEWLRRTWQRRSRGPSQSKSQSARVKIVERRSVQ